MKLTGIDHTSYTVSSLERSLEFYVGLLGFEVPMEVHGFLKDHGVPLDYTVEDLEQDREAHRHLGL